ncbi:MAG: hypothetical protein WCQ99_16260, partial [Pseudomonadota bacterium]
FMTGNYIKERLCELAKLDTSQIHQTLQIGRTPEFNTMNIRNIQRFLPLYPAGSTIGIIYVTRGLPWSKDETAGEFGAAHPWSKEVYHDNAYLNYLSWKKAVREAFGGATYNLVFTRGGIESDLRADNYFTYGVNKTNENGGVFIRIRDAIQTMKGYGISNILVVPCHWNYDNLDTIVFSKEVSGLPMTPKADVLAGKYDYTHCEDSAGTVAACGSAGAAAKITVMPSYSDLPQEFATAYYVMLQGTIEKFGVYPYGEEPAIGASRLITKLAGGAVEVTDPSSEIKGAKIDIPADPYPDRPQSFYYYTNADGSATTNALPVNDPADTNDCMWDDTVITIGQRTNPPAMSKAYPAGPAVHFGPYRTLFNRDVTLTIPCDGAAAKNKPLQPYIYNHTTKDWDPIDTASIDRTAATISFTTKVLGLFRAASLEPTLIKLSSFGAKHLFGRVVVSWQTEAETDNAGFNIYRADKEGGEYIKINDAIIPAKGSASEGSAYTFIDKKIQFGKSCSYKLEDIDLSGKATMHGPVSARFFFL